MSKRRGQKLSNKAQLARERKKSKRLGYSLTYARQKRERAASKKSIATAKKISSVVPSLKKLASKTRLTPAEKAKITRYAKEVAHVNTLRPISKKVAREHPEYLFKKGVQAINFSNVSSTAKVEYTGDGFFIESNGRTWLYWPIHKKTKRTIKNDLRSNAEKIFNAQFPIEQAAALAEKAFKNPKVEAVSLWTHAGRADATFATLNQFVFWMNKRWQAGRYVTIREGGYEQASDDPGAWINGIAIQLRQAQKKIKKTQAAKGKKRDTRKKNRRR